MQKLLLFLMMLMSSTSILARHQALETYIDSLASIKKDSFLVHFTYETYLDSFQLDNIRELDVLRNSLIQKGIDGDEFIFFVFEHYMSKQVLDFNNLDTLEEAIRIAEVAALSGHYLPSDVYIYYAVSDLIFNTISDTVQKLINDDKLDKYDLSVNYLLQRMGRHNYYIDIKTSNWVKLRKYFEEGRYGYIWHKFMTTYRKEFLIALCIGIPIAIAFLWFLIRWYRRRKAKKIQGKSS